MNTKELMKWTLARLKECTAYKLKQVEPYEGQFEDADNLSVFPPAAFVTINRAENERATAATPAQLSYSISVYLVANYVSGSSLDTIYDLMDNAVAALNDKGVRYDTPSEVPPAAVPTHYLGRCILQGMEYIGILPGMTAYRLDFKMR